MRIWSVDPSLLDAKGLVACWRETLLAQKVLQGLTKGYKNHPQLDRFKASPDPLATICAYLHGLADEAARRGYSFNRSLIVTEQSERVAPMAVTQGQVDYELEFLKQKVEARDPQWYLDRFASSPARRLHPLFYEVAGGIEPWEKLPPAK